MAHVTGASRYQATLFPEVLDEVVGPDDTVRVIDAFVETLDLAALGFSKVAAEEMGRPPYAPGDLLKLYIYGYLHRIRASRRLEAETHRNVQVMWLLNRLTPAFKTIADFRKDHVEAIVGVCRAFIRFCREQSLFGAELLAIDGTKIAAVASRKQVMTPKRIKKMNAAIDRKIAEYLASMDEADREEPGSAGKPADIAAAIEALKAQKARLQGQAEDLAARGLKQMVMTEREAKLMRTPHGHAVAYNAQTAVDVEHKLIVAFDLTNEGNDYRQLHPMAVQGKAAVGADEVTVVADTGYSNGEHGALCERDGITAIVPRAETVNPNGAQYFSRDRFSYDRESDSWRCPAGATLSLFKTSHTQKKKEYTSRSCGSCALKPQCTEASHRARFLRRCAGGDAPPGDGRAGMDEAPPGNRRASVRDDEVAHGPPPVPDKGIEESQGRTGPRGAVLQSQTGDQHPRSTGAAGSAGALYRLTKILVPSVNAAVS